MNLLATISNLVASIVQPTKPLYTTVVYPSQGKAVVLHDGLNICSERMWYQHPNSLTGEEEKSTDPLDLHIDDNAAWVEPVMQTQADNYSLLSSFMDQMDNTWVNPANGLPMMDGCVDVMGNAYGMDSMSDGLWFDHGGTFAE
ncbi:hypothetical protein [Pseudomonas aeruginosa]|uniref:hypothetical protein n=1 Tax=Pseudomonas aeruginosa TaxID=287 RepID=UPI0015DA4809|nr:hypothetical protein [Pseudomonas aeruginosa]EKU9560216.1 hypothetical protein [Pseudomonas aeruginosa]ELH7262738.1 hypothetical protein [Pseudomonas aeruginosa]ELL1153989.1 hypothetical protein [Pseudomonas aeruginosa]MDF1652893.1 hypothetical protein [Pseudomonas aeruginosa]MDN3867509.1 hypothetical protein [Pseudomonas aeruginosa]